MAVQHNQNASDTTFNEAFLSRKQDSDTVGVVGLKNADEGSGAEITNVQKELNSISSWLGKSLNTVKDALPGWISNRRGSSADTVKARIEAIDQAFAGTTGNGGHTHSGEAGQGPKLQASDINVTYDSEVTSVQSAMNDLQSSVQDLQEDSSSAVIAHYDGRNLLGTYDRNAEGGVGRWVPFLARFKYGLVDEGSNEILLWPDGPGYTLREGTPLRLEEVGELPPALNDSTTYYARNPVAGKTQLSLTPGGDPIELGGMGSLGDNWLYAYDAPSTGQPTGAEESGMIAVTGEEDEEDVIAGSASYKSGEIHPTGGVSCPFVLPAEASGEEISVSFSYKIRGTYGGDLKVFILNEDTGEMLPYSSPSVADPEGGIAVHRGTFTAPTGPAKLRLILFRPGDGDNEGGSGGTVELVWDSVYVERPARAGSIGGGSGGGGSLQWYEAELSPVPSVVNGMKTYEYAAADDQRLYLMLKVPASYVTGTQITLTVGISSAGNTDDVHFKALTQLIRPGEGGTLITGGPTYTSTNDALELGEGTANRLMNITLDLTDASGEVSGSVEVEPGDALIVRLYRDTDTSTLLARVIPDFTEVSYD